MANQYEIGKNILAKTDKGEVIEFKIKDKHSSLQETIGALNRRTTRHEVLGVVSAIAGVTQLTIGCLAFNPELANPSTSISEKFAAITLGLSLSVGSVYYNLYKAGDCERIRQELEYSPDELPNIRIPLTKRPGTKDASIV